MECQYCQRDTDRLTKISIYGEGLWVCKDCYQLIDKHRHHPYSQVMEKVAMFEAGYHANRKLAEIGKD